MIKNKDYIPETMVKTTPVKTHKKTLKKEQKSKKPQLHWILLGINVLFLVLLFPGVTFAALSVMIFDAPGSSEIVLNHFLFWGIFTFPLSIILSFPATWISYACKQKKLAFLCSLLPVLNVVWVVISIFLLIIF